MTEWIIAFDAGCQKCRATSDQVRSALSSSSLEVRDLTDPEVAELRRKALGETPPWLPTLIAVEESGVRAWTGTALSMRLALLLGPAQSVRVVRALAQEQRAIIGPDRRRLLKAIPGLALGATIVSGGAAYADTSESRNQAQLDIKEIHGSEAAEILEAIASDRSVRELGRALGIEPNKAVTNGVVEQIPKGVAGNDPQRYVSITWVGDPEETVRTSHFVSADGAIKSNIFRLSKSGSEPTMEYGALGGKTVKITQSQAENDYRATPNQGFWNCLGACLGIDSALVAVIAAGCGAACAVTAGAACAICFAAAAGFGASFVLGCFAGCS